MKKIEIITKPLPNAEMRERIPTLLGKHYGIQMANIWKFGVSTGLRLGDMLAIEMKSISDCKSLITIHKARTGETQELYLPLEATEVISSIRKAHPSSKYLFQSHRSRNVTNKKLSPVTRQAVSLAFREVGEILGIPLTPQMMRQIHIARYIDRLV